MWAVEWLSTVALTQRKPLFNSFYQVEPELLKYVDQKSRSEVYKSDALASIKIQPHE